MKFQALHPWDLTPQEAVDIQKRLSSLVVQRERMSVENLELVAGVDVSFARGSLVGFAAAVVMEYPSFSVVDSVSVEGEMGMPYIPGLLSFREAPLILDALSRLHSLPQLILVDGNGVAHPRRLGLASHLGILLDWPTVGCAKSKLLGHHQELGNSKGDWVPWYQDREIIGAVVRTRRDVKPLYVSVGHRVSLEQAINLVLACVTKYRIPEPIRAAHKAVNLRRERG